MAFIDTTSFRFYLIMYLFSDWGLESVVSVIGIRGKKDLLDLTG